MTHELKPFPTEEQIPAEDNQQLRNASRVAAIIFGSTLIMTVFLLLLAWQTRAWQLYAVAAIAFVLDALNFSGLRLVRGGRIRTGMLITIGSIMVLLPFVSLLVSGIGVVLGFVIPVTLYFYASQTLQAKDTRRILFISIAIGILVAATDLLNLEYRLQVPALQTFIPFLTAFIVLLIAFFIARQAWQGNLRVKLTSFFALGAVMPLLVAGALVGYQTYNNQLDQMLLLESQVSKRVAEQVENFILDREAELRVLTDVRSLGNLPRDEQEALLTGLLSAHNIYDELILVDGAGRERIFLSRIEVVKPEDFTSRVGSDEYELPKATGQTYFGPVTFDEQTGEPRMIIAIPVTNLRTGEMSYALIANFRFKTVWDLMAQADVVGSGIVYMINDENQVIAHKNPSVVLQGTQVELPLQDAYTQGIDGTDVAMARTPVTLNEQTFSIIAERPRSEAIDAIRNSLIIIGVIIGLTILGAFAFGAFMARLIATPIITMAEAAQSVSAGDFSQRVNVSTKDEVGTLATAFNSMTVQLQETLEGLEQRVAARTQDLATVAEVGTATATILESKDLLQEVVNLTKDRFNLYHSHIYLLDENGENLVLTAGAGEPGRIMVAEKRSIPLSREQSLVARAARERKVVTVNDVTQEPGFLPNPLLPDTRSELAVPMIVGGNVIGVFDIQSEQVGRFTDSDINIQTTLAAQLAVSIQNVRSFERSRKEAELQSLVNVIGSRIQRATSIEDTLQTAIRELGTAIGATRVKASIKPATDGGATATVLPPKPVAVQTEGEEQAGDHPAESESTFAE